MFKKLGMLFVTVFLTAMVALGLSACKEANEIESVSFEGAIKTEYVRNEDIDLSAVCLKITYKNGKTETHPIPYEGVEVTGNDTSVVGDDFTITFSYKDESKTFTYSVRNPILTLEFGNGSWDEKTSVTINAEANYTDVSQYVPEPNDLGYEFAGWFYDESFTSPVKYNFGENKIDTSTDVTVYAGYDLDYSDKFEYEESSDGKITLTKLSDYFGVGDLYIPATIKLRPVVKIGDNFVDELMSGWIEYGYLTFAEDSSVTEIGNRAFYNVRSITEISLPESLKKIGEEAFCGISVTSIEIPASVESLAAGAFSSNTMLETVTFDENSKLNFLGKSAFAYCSAVSEIILPETLTVISPYAFNYCSNLEEVYIGQNVKQIGLHAFASCSGLVSINISENNANYKSIDGNVYSKDGKTFVRYCFGHNEEEFTLSSGVTSIYESAFDATGLNHVLKKINLPETLTNINDYAFKELDAEFTIPASVSYLSENALVSYAGSKFIISEENPYFSVKDGVLYSKDFKTLVAVPVSVEIEKFILDSRVETIASGALVSNKNIKYIIIPADSALKLIKENAISLFNAKNLGGLYIEKAEPFEIEENAFKEKTEYAASAVTIYVPESVKEKYIAKLSGVVYCDNVRLSDCIIDISSAYASALEEIKDKLSITETGTEDEFAETVDDYIVQILAGVSYDFDIYAKFKDIYRVLDAAYYAVGSARNSNTANEVDFDSTDLSLIAIYEEKTITALANFYNSVDDATLAQQKSFYNVKEHYLCLPESISGRFSSADLNFDEILARTDKIIEIQENIIKAANEIVANISTKFDVDYAKKIYSDYQKYDVTLVSRRWSDILNINAIDCSLLINEFLNTPQVPGNLKKLDRLLYEYYDEKLGTVLGISNYLNSSSYFKAQALRSRLYRYDEFALAFAEYEATGRDKIVKATNEAVNEYDLTKFDYNEAFVVYENYSNLTELERNYEYWDKFVAIVLRININVFMNIELSEETFDDASEIYIAIMEDYKYKYLTCLTEEDEARLTAQIDKLFTIFKERNAEFVAEINKITSEYSTVTEDDAEKFINLFNAADDIGGYYPVTMVDSEGEPYETNATEIYATFVIIGLKKEIVSSFETITDENYSDFNKYIYGDSYYDYETGNYVQIRGMSYYANFIKSYDWYNIYEKAILTEEEIAKYNDLSEQFNAFWGSTK